MPIFHFGFSCSSCDILLLRLLALTFRTKEGLLRACKCKDEWWVMCLCCSCGTGAVSLPSFWMLWFFGKQQRCWNYSFVWTVNMGTGLVSEGIFMGVPPGTVVKEPALLLHTHPCTERTDNLLWGPMQLPSASYHSLPPQLQFTTLLAGLRKQIMDNLNAGEIFLSIKTTTTSWTEYM